VVEVYLNKRILRQGLKDGILGLHPPTRGESQREEEYTPQTDFSQGKEIHGEMLANRPQFYYVVKT
jgi:hypothetical protein